MIFSQTRIDIIATQAILQRWYKRNFHELGNYLFHLPEMPSDEEVEKLKNELFLKEDVLEIDGTELQIVHYYFVEDNLNSYQAWVKNQTNLFYLHISLKNKDWGNVIVKKTSLKPIFFDEIEVIDKDFIKTKTEVFYLGKKIAGADAESFQKTICDYFYEDKNRIYSFQNFKIAFLEKEANTNYFFIPMCVCFASQNFVYRLHSWTDKIEKVTGDFTGTIFHHDLNEILALLFPHKELVEREHLACKVTLLNNYESVFNYLFSDFNPKHC